jgi:anthranilate synthase component I
VLLLVSDELAVVDNVLGKLHLVVYADPRRPQALAKAHERLEQLRHRLAHPLPESLVLAHPAIEPPAASVERTFTEAGFLAAVGQCKEAIMAGELMQVQISQRSSRPFDASALALYRALRSVNPSPYMYYFDFADHHVVGASPEILVRLAADTITVRPIAGTRPRGTVERDDLALEHELLNDPKEIAEHIMLVDLGRNDVGRVAVTGSVEVTERLVVERYSHVMHIVSNVRGRLAAGCDAFDAFRATFPAGTLSGAPKVRAMEIIEELEPVRRGVYGGAVGYFDFSGNMDTGIAIRTVLCREGRVYVQAGAGIVADSVPEREHLECLNKARGMFQALRGAEDL